MPTVDGILETALYVADVGRAAEFYRRVFEFDLLVESDRLAALDVVGRHVLLLFKAGGSTVAMTTSGGVIPGHDSSGTSHFAFAIAKEDVPAWRQRLAALAVPIESEVNWERGGLSLYFRDPDGHLGELVTPGTWRTY